MLLPLLLATFGMADVAAPDREAAVIEACATWAAGLAAGVLPQTHTVGPDGLCFSGEITTDSSAAFVEAVAGFDPTKPLVVVLTSQGGEINAGMAMGEALVPRTTTVVAQKTCLSSCANYPFLAGDRRVIGQGALLAYHGGAFEEPETHWTALQKEWSQTMNARDLEASMTASRDYVVHAVARQSAFLESVGADVDLFRWMQDFNEMPEAQRLGLCPVPGALMYVISDALFADHGVIIHENGGPRSDDEVAAELDRREAPGAACYWD